MNRKIVIALALAVGLAVLATYFSRGMRVAANAPQAIAPASAILKPANAAEIRQAIRDLKSPLVLVNFWASWCEPCKKEFPGILSVREKLKAKGFNVVFVSIDEPADFKLAEDFLRGHKVDFQTFYKGYSRLELVNEIFPKWEGAVPASILVDSKLDIVDAWEGDASPEEFEKRVLAQLKGT